MSQSTILSQYILPLTIIEGTPSEVALGIAKHIIEPTANKLEKLNPDAGVDFCIALFGAISGVLNLSCAGDVKKFENAIESIKMGMGMAVALEKAGVPSKPTRH